MQFHSVFTKFIEVENAATSCRLLVPAKTRRTSFFSSMLAPRTLCHFSSFQKKFQVIVMGTDDPNTLAAVEFEVYGLVQGCYFTKYCKELAEQLGILGYVKNSKKGTIVGKIQGHREQLDHMIDWLSTTGSPGCKIEKCDLTNWEYSTKWGYTDFSIRF